jgi:hypothetical protein
MADKRGLERRYERMAISSVKDTNPYTLTIQGEEERSSL